MDADELQVEASAGDLCAMLSSESILSAFEGLELLGPISTYDISRFIDIQNEVAPFHSNNMRAFVEYTCNTCNDSEGSQAHKMC